MKKLGIGFLIIVAISMFTGCAAFRISVDNQNPATSSALGAKYDQADLINWVDEITKKILDQPWPPQGEKRPIVAILGIQNRTKSHLDTQALTDGIKSKLLDSGRVLFVNTAARDKLLSEQKYQLANASSSSRVNIGKQLGAKYMITGSLYEIEANSGRQVRVSSKKDIFYRLVVEVTDIETSLVVVSKSAERMRRESKPIIGW